jgi:hypothetical protein
MCEILIWHTYEMHSVFFGKTGVTVLLQEERLAREWQTRIGTALLVVFLSLVLCLE